MAKKKEIKIKVSTLVLVVCTFVCGVFAHDGVMPVVNGIKNFFN